MTLEKEAGLGKLDEVKGRSEKLMARKSVFEMLDQTIQTVRKGLWDAS